MRITERLLFDNLTSNLQRNIEDLFKLQDIVATGKKVNRPSDDPAAISRILGYDGLISRVDQYIDNIGHSTGSLVFSDSVLGNAADLLTRVKEIATAQANDTMNSDDRRNASLEVQELFDQLVQLANAKLDNRYIFAGYKTQAQPFSTIGDYSGDNGKIMVEIGPGVTIQTNLPGDDLFKGAGGGIDLFLLLDNLKTSLENNDGISIRNSLDGIDSALGQIMDGRAGIGARLNRLESTTTYMEDLRLNVTKLRSDLEDADITKVVSELTLQQNILEALMASTARIIEPTLLDFLR